MDGKFWTTWDRIFEVRSCFKNLAEDLTNGNIEQVLMQTDLWLQKAKDKQFQAAKKQSKCINIELNQEKEAYHRGKAMAFKKVHTLLKGILLRSNPVQILTNALTEISKETKDANPPFRSMPQLQMVSVASEALREYTKLVQGNK